MDPINSAYAVSQELQQILAERRVAQRQSMIDDLNKRNVESEIANRDMNTRTTDLERQARTSELAALDEKNRANTLWPGAPLTDPTQHSYWQKTNPAMIVPGAPGSQDPTATGGEGPVLPARPDTFHGTFEQTQKLDAEAQKRDALKRADDARARLLAGGDNLTPTERALLYHDATNSAATEGILNSTVPYYIQDDKGLTDLQGHRVTGNIAANAKIGSRAPAPPHDYGTVQGMHTIDGKEVPGEGVVYRNGHFVIEPIPGGGSIAPRGAPPRPNALPYNPAAFNKYLSTLSLHGTAGDQAKQGALEGLINTVSTGKGDKEDQEVREVLRLIVHDKQMRKTPFDVLVNAHRIKGDADTLAIAREVLGLITPPKQ